MDTTGHYPGAIAYHNPETGSDEEEESEFEYPYDQIISERKLMYLKDQTLETGYEELSLDQACLHYHVKVKPVKQLGEGQRGLFAVKEFKTGEVICAVTGRFISRALAKIKAIKFDRKWANQVRPSNVHQPEWLFPQGAERKNWALLMSRESPAHYANDYRHLAAEPNAHLYFLPRALKEFLRLDKVQLFISVPGPPSSASWCILMFEL